MRKIFILSLLMFSVISQAQVELWLGPKAGINIANVSDMDGKSYVGAYGGAAFAVKFSHFYALQPEIGVSMQGASEVYNTREDLKMTYFTIGVINKFYFTEGFHLLIGPEFNFEIDDSYSESDQGIYDDEGNYLGYLYTQPFDFAVVGGLGYDLPFGLSFEARYKQGLQDVIDFFNWDNGKSRLNQVIQLGVVYKFRLK